MKRIALGLVLALISGTADAATRVWISEFATIGQVPPAGQAQIGVLPDVVDQATLDISTGVKTSAPFNTSTRFIRIVCELQCAIRGGGVTATPSNILLPAFLPEYFAVNGGDTLSVILAP